MKGANVLEKIFNFIKKLLKKIDEDDTLPYAYQLTYSLLLSIFPFLIFLFTLIAYLNLDSGYILNFLKNNLASDIYNMISNIVIDLVDNQRGSLMSVSIVTAIYSASLGFRAFMKGTNKAMDTGESRNILARYALSIMWVLVLASVILIALLGIVFGNQILILIKEVFPNLMLDNILNAIRIILPVALIFFMFIAFYMFVPVRSVKFKYALPGSIFSSAAILVLTVGFQVYVDNFANYSKLYGALGTLVALMLWLLLISMIMLLGASINSLLIEERKIKDPYIGIAKKVKSKIQEFTE